MGLEEFSVGVAEMRTLSSETFEFATGDKDCDWLPAARQFNLNASFGLVDDSGKS